MDSTLRKLIVDFGAAHAAFWGEAQTAAAHRYAAAGWLLSARAALFLYVGCPPELTEFHKAHLDAMVARSGDDAVLDAEQKLARLGQQLAAADWMADMAAMMREVAGEVERQVAARAVNDLMGADWATRLRKAADILLRKHGEKG